jgi:hypothetical protein
MSSCLILQQYDKIFIGADTASSVNIDGKFYRYNKSISKLFEIKNTIVFCSGILSEVNSTIEYIKQNINNLVSISLFLKKLYIKNKDVYSIELFITKVKNGKSIIYQISEYNNFEIIEHIIDLNNIKILAGGFKTKECCNIATKHINNGEYVDQIFQKTFDEISCNEIGGMVEVYDISINGINKKYSNKINEKNIQYLLLDEEGDSH